MSTFNSLSIIALAVGLWALPVAASAQTGAEARADAAALKATKDTTTSVQQLKASFSEQRKAMLRQRQELLQKLKAAKTAAERQQILSEAQKKNKDLVNAQHDQAKLIQNDIKEQLIHDGHRGPPGG